MAKTADPYLKLSVEEADPMMRLTGNSYLAQSTAVDPQKRTLSSVLPADAQRHRNPSEMPSEQAPNFGGQEIEYEDYDSESSLSEELFRDYECFSDDEDDLQTNDPHGDLDFNHT